MNQLRVTDLVESITIPGLTEFTMRRYSHWLSRAVRCLPLLACAFIQLPAHAAPGDLDSSFGAGFGKAIIQMTSSSEIANAVLVLPDKKSILAGDCVLPTTVCLTRLNSDGSVDPTFGTNGRVFLSAPPYQLLDTRRDLIRNPDGKLTLVSGCSTPPDVEGVCLVRLLENGSVDTSFATGGVALAQLPFYYIALNRLLVTADGKWLIAARCYLQTSPTPVWSSCSFRFNADGTVDQSYGIAGAQNNQIMTETTMSDAALQPDGRLIVVGRCRPSDALSAVYQFCSQRIGTNGILDASYGTNGSVLTSVLTGNQTFVGDVRVVLQANGRIVQAGLCLQPPPIVRATCVVRYLPNGSIEPMQGQNVYTFNLPADANGTPRFSLTHLALQSDGKLLFVGTCLPASSNADRDFCIARRHNDGAPDASFGLLNSQSFRDGYVRTAISPGNPSIAPDDFSMSAALTLDGKLLVVGQCVSSTGNLGDANDFCAARYELGPFNSQQCTLDFDGDSEVRADTDGLINLRVMLGIRGDEVMGGIPVTANATRTSWALVREYLNTQCGLGV